jgi:hypothetical protein
MAVRRSGCTGGWPASPTAGARGSTALSENAVLYETHVYVRSSRDTHVATCAVCQERTCTCVSAEGGGEHKSDPPQPSELLHRVSNHPLSSLTRP